MRTLMEAVLDLPEVGNPIITQTREVEAKFMDAKLAFEEAEAALVNLKLEIAKHWKRDEIVKATVTDENLMPCQWLNVTVPGGRRTRLVLNQRKTKTGKTLETVPTTSNLHCL